MDNLVKVNITLEIHETDVQSFESWLREQLKVIDFKIIPDTSELYESDPAYQKMCKGIREAQKARDRYYNEKRNQ
jgi:hypothetical protein